MYSSISNLTIFYLYVFFHKNSFFSKGKHLIGKKGQKLFDTYGLSILFTYHRVKGLFHTDWLSAGRQHLLLVTAGRGRYRKSGNFPCTTCIGELLAGFLISAHHVTHNPLPGRAISQLFSRSRTNYFKLFISLLCVTYISEIQ